MVEIFQPVMLVFGGGGVTCQCPNFPRSLSLQMPPTASAGNRGTVTEFITKLRVAETPRIAHKLRKGNGLVSLELTVPQIEGSHAHFELRML